MTPITAEQMRRETLPEQKRRHIAERNALIKFHNEQRITQTEAAHRLSVSPRALNNIIRREGIQWHFKYQGRGSAK